MQDQMDRLTIKTKQLKSLQLWKLGSVSENFILEQYFGFHFNYHCWQHDLYVNPDDLKARAKCGKAQLFPRLSEE